MYQGINFTNRIVILAILGLFFVGAARGATFTVATTGDYTDQSPGDGVCRTFLGFCTFRAAIAEANALAGPDTIAFGIAGGGVKTLSPSSAYPDIVDVITIDGWTQGGAGYTGPPLIEIDGTNIPSNGLMITAGSSTIRGLIINRFSLDDGIDIWSNGGNIIQGCYIGTDATGTIDLGNLTGIQVQTANNLIGGSTAATRNLISGNGSAGVKLSSAGATGNVVKGNLIGTDVTGTAAIPNSFTGVYITFGASSNLVGGELPGERNLISGNTGSGIVILGDGDTNSNKVIGNYVGTTVNGNAALGNLRGVSISDSSNNQIGGNTCAKRNIISGNLAEGVRIWGALATGNSVTNNIIGTNPDGIIPLGNGDHGVEIWYGSDNRIGGGTGEGNIIAFNGGSGVFVEESGGNSILRNSIYENAGLGIELSVNWVLGVTPNDLDDVDTGANNLQNFPVIIGAWNQGGVTNIPTSLNSTPSTSFTIEFFSSPSCDSSGNGEGRLFLGSTNVATDVNGDVLFNFSPAAPVASGQFITATATRGSAPFDTSEFSACVQVP